MVRKMRKEMDFCQTSTFFHVMDHCIPTIMSWIFLQLPNKRNDELASSKLTRREEDEEKFMVKTNHLGVRSTSG